MTAHLKVKKQIANEIILDVGKEGIRDFECDIQKDDSFVYVPLLDKPKFLPDGTEVVDILSKKKQIKYYPKTSGGAFDLIGSLAILKYRDEAKSKRIAHEILSTNRNVKSVYSDLGVIGPYRIRNLRFIEGEEIYVTDYRENGVSMKVDLRGAYFSPRLATERLIVSRSVRAGETIVDMFSGIGPFSLNIARFNKCEIYAIDSNPRAIELMMENINRNHLRGIIHPILGQAESEILKLPLVDRIIMNLPHESFVYVHNAMNVLKRNGIINYYEIATIEALEDRMEQLSDLGLSIISKRVVHSYSRVERMYSLVLKKEG